MSPLIDSDVNDLGRAKANVKRCWLMMGGNWAAHKATWAVVMVIFQAQKGQHRCHRVQYQGAVLQALPVRARHLRCLQRSSLLPAAMVR